MLDERLANSTPGDRKQNLHRWARRSIMTSETTAPDISGIGALRELHGRSVSQLLMLIATSVLAGLTEAIALLMFIEAAISGTSDQPTPTRLLGQDLDATPGTLFVMAAIMTVATMLAHRYVARGSARAGLRIARNARRQLIDSYMNARYSYIVGTRDGQLQEALTGLSTRSAIAAQSITLGATALVMMASLLATAFLVAPVVGLSVVVALIPVVFVLRPLMRSTPAKVRIEIGQTLGLAEQVAATQALIREYRSNGVSDTRAEQLNNIADDASTKWSMVRETQALQSFWLKDFSLLALIVIVGVIYATVDLRAGGSAAAIVLVVRSLAYASQAYSSANGFNENAAAAIELVKITTDVEAQREPRGHRRIDRVGRIEFENVGYGYTRNLPVLSDVRLTIEHGQTVGLVGPSGSGKTTLSEILVGLRRPQTGRVSIGGIDLAEIDPSNWATLCAFVPQNPHVAQMSIGANIRFLRPWITADDVERAAHQAHIYDTVMALEDDFDTMLGSRSQGLSGGQTQRLAIARALAGRPQLLVLDEPTSALDVASEHLFRTTLKELHGTVTMLVIAHRTSTLDTCDAIINIRDGRIVETADGS